MMLRAIFCEQKWGATQRAAGRGFPIFDCQFGTEGGVCEIRDAKSEIQN